MHHTTTFSCTGNRCVNDNNDNDNNDNDTVNKKDPFQYSGRNGNRKGNCSTSTNGNVSCVVTTHIYAIRYPNEVMDDDDVDDDHDNDDGDGDDSSSGSSCFGFATLDLTGVDFD
mmetsp:Transcript_30029/g.34509  ORF Transcript_30029/g.34509 Transcript_30029/m.34509 type:complete len:114 (-) Transcript_30029:24-365(-)